jgi:hypothetical protein
MMAACTPAPVLKLRPISLDAVMGPAGFLIEIDKIGVSYGMPWLDGRMSRVV